MQKSPHRSRARHTYLVAVIATCASSISSPALAQNDAAPPGQKPPCVPASSYMLGYDCELFPLPALPGAAPGTAPAAAPIPAAGAAPPLATTAPTEDMPAPAPAPSPPPAATASSDGSPSHAPAYIAFAVGAGGIGMTVAFGVLALGNKSTLNGECNGSNCPSSASSTVSSLKTDGILADVGLGVAVTGVALGAILFATEHGPPSTSGARHVEPWIGLGAAGLKGSF